MATRRFARGDHVRWNSDAGCAAGRIVRVVTSEVEFKGYTVRALKDEPQYKRAPTLVGLLPLRRAAHQSEYRAKTVPWRLG